MASAEVEGEIIGLARKSSASELDAESLTVQIDVGADEGLVSGQSLFIIRDEVAASRIVGRLKVDEVATRTSGTSLVTLYQQLVPQLGDRVVRPPDPAGTPSGYRTAFEQEDTQ